jgi:site-specific DNA-methyltransferase (cytosine-N4-specific)
MAQPSDLPFGSEFSPSQVELPQLLEIVQANQGSMAALRAAILDAFFSTHAKLTDDAAKKAKNRKTLAMNCTLGLRAYGLIDDGANLTDLGQKLYDVRSDEEALYAGLAQHILLNLNGMRLVGCIQEMMAAAEEVNLDTLRSGLAERGVHFPRGGKHPSMMRLWLSKAGVFVGKTWQINPIKLREVLGTTTEDFPQLAKFSAEQRAFLMALANTGITTSQPANEIVKLATATYGVRFPDKSLPKQVLHALEEAGYITTTKTTVGRGSRPFDVTPTEKLNADVILPMLEQLKSQIDPKLLELLKKPLAEILTEIESTDRYVAGLALEALAFKIMRSLAMDYAATRLRAQDTGGAEVDLIFQSARLVFSRWQVQCKNTARVALDDVAKEVGLTHFLKSSVIVIMTTGEVGSQARRYANQIMRTSNLCIVLITGADLEAVKESPAFIIDAFRREAEHAMTLKKLDLGEGD